MPISRVRSVTAIAIAPYSPSIAIANAARASALRDIGGQAHRAESRIVMIARQPDVKHRHLRIELLRERARGVGDDADVGRRCCLQDERHGRVGATLIRRHGQGAWRVCVAGSIRGDADNLEELCPPSRD